MLCDPVDSSPPGSSNHGILQARMLEWVAMCFSRGSSQPKDRTCISWAGRWFLYLWATWQAHLVISKCLFCTSGLEDGLSAVLFPVALHTAVQHSLMGASASSGLRLFSCGVKLFCEVFPASLTWAPTWMTNLSSPLPGPRGHGLHGLSSSHIRHPWPYYRSPPPTASWQRLPLRSLFLSPQLSRSHDSCLCVSLEPLCLFALYPSPSLFSLDSLVHCFSHPDLNSKSSCSCFVPSFGTFLLLWGEKPKPLVRTSQSFCVWPLPASAAHGLPSSHVLRALLSSFLSSQIDMRFHTSGLLNTPGPGAGVLFSSAPAPWLPWGIFPLVPHSMDEGLTLLILMASCASLHESIHDCTLLNVINEWLYLCVDSEHKGSREACMSVKPWWYNTLPGTWGRIIWMGEEKGGKRRIERCRSGPGNAPRRDH